MNSYTLAIIFQIAENILPHLCLPDQIYVLHALQHSVVHTLNYFEIAVGCRLSICWTFSCHFKANKVAHAHKFRYKNECVETPCSTIFLQ